MNSEKIQIFFTVREEFFSSKNLTFEPDEIIFSFGKNINKLAAGQKMARFQQISGKRRVFVKLRHCGIISRAELARQCSLTRPAVSAIIDELISEGMVRELGPGHSTGGKPPIMLEFLPESRCAIGIDLGGDLRIEGVLCDLGCGVVAGDSIAYENNLDSIIEAVSTLIRRLSIAAPGRVPSGVGIAVSAVVDGANEIIGSTTLDLSKKHFARKLEKMTGLTVRLDRRPNAAALAEALFGAGHDSSQLLYITSGRGVGAGIVLDGKIFRGHNGFAGEIGHLLLGDGRELEEAARPSSLPAAYRDVSGEAVDFETFMQRYFSGDPLARDLVMQNAEHLAYAARAAANMFDPDAIVLGGDVLEFGDAHFEHFKEVCARFSEAHKLGRAPLILRSNFGRRGVAVGGAQLILDDLVF